MTAESAYQWLVEYFRDTTYLFSTAELAAWDQRTFIPTNGHEHRSRQMESLARLIHQRSTSPEIDAKLQEVENSAFLSDSDVATRANIRMWRREYERLVRIPERLASELAAAASAGEAAWEAAVHKNDWDAFFPHLEKLISLSKEKAEAIGYNRNPYDALLDEYEVGLTADALSAMFDELRQPLVALQQQIRESVVKPDKSILYGNFSLASQRKTCADLVQAIGYSFTSGRIDESVHPFSVGIGPGDARITTRYNESFLGSGMFGCLHEAGHSLYELGLPEAHYGTPAGMYLSVGIHESQSRLWENQVGRSQAFWQFAKPLLDSHYSSVKSATLEDFVLAVNDVEPGLIRVEADEVTYNLHVLLRFELELALFNNELKPADLPDAWAEKMKEMLGIVPQSNREGAMQDVHWSAGMFGYFPTYTLGNIYAAQLYAAARRDISDMDACLSRGEFEPLLQWLRTHVHHKGQCHTPAELIEMASGKPPSSKYFIEYCRAKFSQLYQF